MVPTQSQVFREIMMQKCDERIALGQQILNEKGLTTKIAPYHLKNDIFSGSFAVLDAKNQVRIHSQGPMVAVDNLHWFSQEDYEKLYLYGVYGMLLKSVAPDQLDEYCRSQYCLF